MKKREARKQRENSLLQEGMIQSTRTESEDITRQNQQFIESMAGEDIQQSVREEIDHEEIDCEETDPSISFNVRGD